MEVCIWLFFSLIKPLFLCCASFRRVTLFALTLYCLPHSHAPTWSTIKYGNFPTKWKTYTYFKMVKCSAIETCYRKTWKMKKNRSRATKTFIPISMKRTKRCLIRAIEQHNKMRFETQVHKKAYKPIRIVCNFKFTFIRSFTLYTRFSFFLPLFTHVSKYMNEVHTAQYMFLIYFVAFYCFY